MMGLWDGEEKGVLGCKYLMEEWDFIKDMKGYLNLDMIGGKNGGEEGEEVVYLYREGDGGVGEWVKDEIGG